MRSASDAHVADGQSATQLEQLSGGSQTLGFGFTQEIDGQARCHGEWYPSDVGQDHHPGGGVGQSHDGGSRHRAAGTNGDRLGRDLHAGMVGPHVGHDIGPTLGEGFEQVGVDLVGGHHRGSWRGHDSGITITGSPD